MSIKGPDDVAGLKKIGKIVADTLRLMKSSARDGMSTLELDRIGRAFFEQFGAKSAPEISYNFPGATCISVNNEIAHGIPGKQLLRKGDLVNIDVSLELDGYFADTGSSFCLEKTGGPLADLCEASHEILLKALRLKAGNLLNRMGRIIETEAKKLGYLTIKNLTGHGVGRALHEEPFDLLNYYEPADRRLAKSGMVIAVETFISTGAQRAIQQADGWTLKTPDGSYVAQHEHTIIVTDQNPIFVTV